MFQNKKAATLTINLKLENNISPYFLYHTTGLNNGHESLKQRRPSRAYLLRQKATGEETVVTLVPIQGKHWYFQSKIYRMISIKS